MAYPILAPRDTWYTQGNSGILRRTITEVRIRDTYTPTGPVTAQWDASAAKDGSITVFVEGTTLTIAGNGSGKIQLSPDASLTFSGNGDNDIYVNVAAASGLDLLDTSEVIEAKAFFRYMAKVKKLDVSGFKTGKCTRFDQFFAGYPSPQIGTMAVEQIIGIESLDVSSAEDINSMFYFCTELEELPIGGWKTGNCKNFTAVLGECHKLRTSKAVEGWDVSSGIYFSHMLCDNYAMTGTLDLSGWDMANAQDVSAIVNDCPNLDCLNITGWDGANLKALAQMCERCRSLKKIIGLSGLKAPNASQIANPQFKYQTAFGEMLSGCESMEDLDFSNLDTRSARKTYDTTMHDMFSGMLRLKKVTLGPNFDWTGGYPERLPTGKDIPVLPTPDPTYITGADGMWYDITGKAYTPEEAIKVVPNTYFASKQLLLIPWTHYQDVQCNDVALREQFDKLMNGGAYAEASNFLRNNKAQLEGKAYIADTINKIVNGVLVLEGKINNGVNLYLSDLAVRYMQMVDELADRKEWRSSIAYKPYNFIDYQNEVYMCIIASQGISPTDSAHWLKIGLRGEIGAPGTNVAMKYEWNETRSYLAKDLVIYQGDIYVAVKQNKGVTPGSDEATWQIFAMSEKGYIHVGVEEPENPTQNTIWFRTNMNPLAVEPIIKGEFYRYQASSNEWEIMYPTTLFTWVKGREDYAPIAKVTKVEIKPGDWGLLNGKYVFVYRSYSIVDNSYIEIGIGEGMSKEAFAIYSKFGMEIMQNGFRLTINRRPDITIPIQVKIQ